MLLIVGLGNPGEKYRNNRHNIGFMAVERIADEHHFAPFRTKFSGQISDGEIGGTRVLLLKPDTFMNRSGDSVGAAASFYKIPPENIIVLHDELDLAPGKVRVKQGGGHGGHNGLRSIDPVVGKDYFRVRLGIGHPGHKDRVHAYVLGDFAKSDEPWREALVAAIAANAELLAKKDMAGFMNKVALTTAQPEASPAKTRPRASKAPGKGQSHIPQARQAQKPAATAPKSNGPKTNSPKPSGPMAAMLKKLFDKD